MFASNHHQYRFDEIGLLTQLESLYLGWNRLTTLPDSLARLTGLRSINVEGNDAGLLERVDELLPDLHRCASDESEP